MQEKLKVYLKRLLETCFNARRRDSKKHVSCFCQACPPPPQNSAMTSRSPGTTGGRYRRATLRRAWPLLITTTRVV